MTLVRDAVAEWLKRDQAKSRTAAEVARAFDHDVLPIIGHLGIKKATRAEVLKIIDAKVDAGHPIRARRIHAFIHRFFQWSLSRGLIDFNPLAGVDKPGEEVVRERVLSNEELRLVVTAARSQPYPFGPAVQLLALTGQRLREVLEASWSEFDLEARLWTIPAERAKNKRTHVVPLSDEVVAILAPLPRNKGGDFLFTTTGTTPASGFQHAKVSLDRAIMKLAGEALPHWTFHDLRRTFVTGASEHLEIAPHIVEAVVNHISGAAKASVAGVYNKAKWLPQRAAALQAWATYVTRLLDGPSGARKGAAAEMHTVSSLGHPFIWRG